MSATNDGTVNRVALPGVPDPLLPGDIVNKGYLENYLRRYVSSVVVYDPQTITNTTTLQSTQLTLPIEAQSDYRFHVWAILSGTTSASSKVSMISSTGGGAMRWQFSNKNSQPDIMEGSGASAEAQLQTGNIGRVELDGLYMGNVAGSLTFQFAQKTAETSNLLLLSPSYMTLEKLYPPPD